MLHSAQEQSDWSVIGLNPAEACILTEFGTTRFQPKMFRYTWHSGIRI